MNFLDPDPGLDEIVIGAGSASLTGVVIALLASRLAGQGAAQTTARNHGV